MAEYHFDFSFVRSGPPVVTLSATGIAFNAGARALLGHPNQIDIGYDAQAKAIGVCAHDPASNSEPFEFEGRQKDGWGSHQCEGFFTIFGATNRNEIS